MWVEKEDTGKESNTEAEKGLASDSFKRACVNWGIGRELYTAPRMFVGKENLKTLKNESYNGKDRWTCRDTFTVTEIQYDGKKIAYVKIVNDRNKVPILFGVNPNHVTPAPVKAMAEEKKAEDVSKLKISEAKASELVKKAECDGIEVAKIAALYKVADIADMTEKQYKNCLDNWEKIKEL